jgi:hypothetical protein
LITATGRWIFGTELFTKYKTSIAYTDDGKTFHPMFELEHAVELPEYMYQVPRPCIIALENGNIFVLSNDSCWLYEKHCNSWKQGPNMKLGPKHFCSVMRRGNGRQEVIAFGAGMDDDHVEIFSFDDSQWRAGKRQ